MENPAVAKAFQSCSIIPALGTCKVHTGASSEEEARKFLGLLAAACESDLPMQAAVMGADGIAGSSVEWRRHTVRGVFPFYMESLAVDDSGFEGDLAIRQGFPGQWFVHPNVLDPAHDEYFGSNSDQWNTWAADQSAAGDKTGGLSYNVLEIPAGSLKDGLVDVRPLLLHALSPDGRAVDLGDTMAQSSIANAFWQTFWATGATRAERGSVFPVAFFPVDRSSRLEFAPPFHERYVSLRRRLFGRSAIVGYVLEELTRRKALLFHTKENRFGITPDYQPEDSSPAAADILLAVTELNRTGWLDAYTGANAKTFKSWAESQAAGTKGEPWPYNGQTWDQKIRAAGHGNHDYLEALRLRESTATATIHRVVPYSGCAYLYQVMLEMDQLLESGKVQDFQGELIGGTNSTFFLNFPEEYSALHSAMNEPVSLLVEEGRTHQIRTLKRAAFVLSKDGEAMITTRASNRLNSDVLVFEGESSSTTYFARSDKGFRENRFGPLFFGAAVVGNSIVETFEEIATEVPPAGWLIGDSEAFGGKIDPVNAAEVQVRKPGSLEDLNIRHAFAIGPLLVQDGVIVPLDQSREEFASIKLSAPLTFDETSGLARTELPSALLDCESRGVPPTRFPYDWNVTRAPRSAIGIKEDGSVLVVVVDGRADISHSAGATLAELAAIMQNLGCKDAMNMDGGGSSVMFVHADEALKGKLRPDLRDGIVNLPSDMGGVERLLPVPLVIYKRKN